MSIFLSRTFVVLCLSGLAAFIGGAWLASEAIMNAGVVLLFTSGLPLVLFVPLLLTEAVQSVRLANRSSKAQRSS